MEVDAAFGNWLAGFIDGEGCFFIRVAGKQARDGMPYLQCCFSIEVRLDDATIIREIHKRTAIGALKYRERAGKNGNDKPQITWYLQKISDCVALVALLDQHPLRAKKSRDFAVWRTGVEIQASTYGSARHAQLAVLKEELEEIRRYDSDLKVPREPAAAPQLRLIV